MKTFWVFMVLLILVGVYILIAGSKDPFDKKESIDLEKELQ